MVLLHRGDCTACYNLKGQFTKNNELQRLSKNFAFINCNSTEEPEDKSYSPDGDYVPRILFFGADGSHALKYLIGWETRVQNVTMSMP